MAQNNLLNLNLDAYRLIFIFENNIRNFIQDKMKIEFGEAWFENVFAEIKERASDNKEKEIKYLSNQNISQDHLNYLFLSDLRKIIFHNWNNVFKQHFDDSKTQSEVKLKFRELEILRNIIAHTNLISEEMLVQLEANYNFFKNYIPGFNENIHNIFKQHNVEKEEQIKQLKEIVFALRSFEKISLSNMSIIKNIDHELYNILINYNKLPRTKKDISKIKDLLNSSKVIQKIVLIIGA